MRDLSLWIAVLATGLSCLFAANGHALHNFSRVRLEELLRAKRREKWLGVLDGELDGLLLLTAAVRTLMNLVILLMAIAYLSPTAGPPGWRQLGLAFGVTAVVIAVVGVAVPISWARYSAEPLIAACLPLLHGCYRIFGPLLRLMHLLDPLVRRVLGASHPDQDQDVEQDILDAVSQGEKSGLVDDFQAQMIEAVVEFPATTVDQIMTPRTDVQGLEVNTPLAEVKKAIAAHGHSRLPVYEEDLDHIVGILCVKDLLQFLGDGAKGIDLRKVVRAASFVPESKTLRDLLEEFRHRRTHMAIVLDEYGGTAGLVTIEDIVEEIVGEIQDEFEPGEEAPDIQRLDERTAEVDGRAYIDDVNDKLALDLPEDEDYDTVGGFVFSTLGHIPEVGESFQYRNVKVTVTQAERTKVNRVRIESSDGQAAERSGGGEA